MTVQAKANGPGEVILTFDDNALLQTLCGRRNANLKRIEKALQVRLNLRGDKITLIGEDSEVKVAQRVLEELYGLLREGYPLYPSDVNHAIQILSGDFKARLRDIFLDAVYVTSKKRIITPKSLAQKEYIDAIRSYDIVFGIGPAGTGKTYLAMATAVAALNAGKINRIMLVRPAVEAAIELRPFLG